MADQHATVHDTLQVGNRMWVVSGCYLGGLGEDSLLGLQCFDRADGHAHGRDQREYFVPESIIRAAVNAGAVVLHKAAHPPETSHD